MNISTFFINRPVFATALSIIIALVGVMAMRSLPIAQYPDIVPPEVTVTTTYPGANAETVSETVASVLAEKINGVQDMLYMYATSADDGSMTLRVSFAIGSDGNIDTVNVTNRVQSALSSLPSSVQSQGVSVQLRSSSILMFATLNSREYDQAYLRNYAALHVVDELKQVSGVGDASVLGNSSFAMRVWLNPDKLAQYNLTPTEVSSAIEAQNTEVSAGSVATAPMDHPRPYTYTISTKGRLSSAQEFRDIILRTNADGSTLRLGDVAKVELGSSSYSIDAKVNGEAMAPIMISQQPGANALSTAEAVKARLAEISKTFPAGMQYSTPYDTTLFINASVDSVAHTFFEALILVAIIVFVFLQNWRTTIIAMSVVPISVVGTFAGMYALGFSINLLSLFGLILAIGIVVDDAILVVENVERLTEEDEDVSIFDAVIEAMREVGGPVLATAFIMASVFVPVGVLSGLTGEFFRQFAITIAISVAISAFVALTFTPAITAILLKRKSKEPEGPIGRLLNAPFRVFDKIFGAITSVYLAVVRFFIRMWIISLVCFVLFTGAALWMYQSTSTSLIPSTDQGLFIAAVNAPDGSSVTRTADYMDSVAAKIRKLPGVKYVTQVGGYDMLSQAVNSARGVFFVTTEPWDQRDVTVEQLIAETMKIGAQTPGGSVMAFNMPPILGLSTTGGLEGYLTSLNGASSEEMQQAAGKLMQSANKNPALAQVFTLFDANAPAYRADIDYNKALAYGVTVDDINNTLSGTMGSSFVNYFAYQGRQFQVYMQNASDFRSTPGDLERIFVRSSNGDRLPLSEFVTLNRISAPSSVTRFNVYNAAKFQGGAAPGYSSGQAVAAMEQEVQKVLGNQWKMNWIGTSYQETHAGGATAAIVFGILMIILILAAQYESWSIPIAVITAVPFGFLGAILAIALRGLTVSVYVEVGMLVVVGLAAKNAILIVEFAQQQRRDHGLSINEAAAESAHLRFRPIIMTSLAFIFGVLPLAFASGAADANSHEIGTTVAGGMVGVAILGSIFVPSYYAMIAHIQEWFSRQGSKGKGSRHDDQDPSDMTNNGDNQQH